MSIRQRRNRTCAGTSTLEFIVVLPFLLIIMLIAVELSRALATYNVVVQASREGAREAVVTAGLPATTSGVCNPFPANVVLARACNLIVSVPSLSPAATNVSVSCPSCAVNSPVTVTVTTTFTSIFADFFAFVGTVGAWWGIPPPALLSQAGFSMSHTTVMRYE